MVRILGNPCSRLQIPRPSMGGAECMEFLRIPKDSSRRKTSSSNSADRRFFMKGGRENSRLKDEFWGSALSCARQMFGYLFCLKEARRRRQQKAGVRFPFVEGPPISSAPQADFQGIQCSQGGLA